MALSHEESINGVSAPLSTMFFVKTKCFDKIVLPVWAALWTNSVGRHAWPVP